MLTNPHSSGVALQQGLRTNSPKGESGALILRPRTVLGTPIPRANTRFERVDADVGSHPNMIFSLLESLLFAGDVRIPVRKIAFRIVFPRPDMQLPERR